MSDTKSAVAVAETAFEGTDDWSVPESVKRNPLFVEVGSGSMIAALRCLDQRMTEHGVGPLIRSIQPHSMLGNQVPSGYVGLYDYNGRPRITLEPGSYWNFSLTHQWRGARDVTSHIDFCGLTAAQVGQGEAMVVLDPQNRVFIIRNGGFAAYGVEGRFRILAIVDTLDLGDQNQFLEPVTKRILGWKREVTSSVQTPTGQVNVSVATFFNVPANNVLIVQQKNRLLSLGAGQHVITNPHTTFRGFYSLGERQHTFKTQPAYTVEGVPVILHLNLRYRVADPVLLTANYDDPLQALINPAQTAVNGVVSRLSYQQFMRAKRVGGDVPDKDHVPWLEEFKAECLRELSEHARQHGIVVESFDVMDRSLDGALGKDLELQAEKVLQNQIEATQIELRNHIETEKQRGRLAVAQVEASMVETRANTEYYAATKAADAKYYSAMKEAAAQAEASALITEQDAKNIVRLAEARQREIAMQGEAYSQVPHGHAQSMQLTLLEVEKRKNMPSQTVWFEGSATRDTVAQSFEVAKGVALAQK